MTHEAFRYLNQQVDLACLDTIHGDMSDYRECLRFSLISSAVDTVGLLFGAVGGMTFSCNPAEEYAFISDDGTLQVAA